MTPGGLLIPIRVVPFFVLFFLVSCGSVEQLSLDESDPDADFAEGEEAVFLFGTDFVSSGQIYTADFDAASSLSNTGVTGLGSSAVIRLFDGLLYVLHDGFSIGSSDNLQILDPSGGLATVNQWSTGNGTNPQDLVVMENKAYISLYNPENDETNVDGAGNPADVIVMNTETGEMEKRLGFFDFLNDDGNRTGRAASMVLADNLIYVCLQDLEGDSFEHNTSGLIGIINTSTDEVEGVITLQGRNPVDIAYSSGEEKLYVANQAPFDFSLGNFDTSTSFGGLEIVNLNDPAGTILIDDEDLGGYVERLSVATPLAVAAPPASADGKVFVVASEMDSATFAFTSGIVSMNDDNEELSGFTLFAGESSDVREMASDGNGRLWIARRTISADDGSASDPRVDVFDISSGDLVGETMEPEVPVTSIAIGEI
ncbi:MAG: hypothetical protein HY541_02060 [Deltaproteobacteria bacterium]|nr:hypothetical protein [Deltaproteobacteria bacterium]